MDEALPLYRGIIDKHHAVMLAGDAEAALRLREEAHNLALRLNNGEPGILAGLDAPGCMLESLTAADDGIVPLWGQTGSFVIEVQGMRVRIEMDGIFGIGAQYSPWMNFSAHAVDWDKPFLRNRLSQLLGITGRACPRTDAGYFRLESHRRSRPKGVKRPASGHQPGISREIDTHCVCVYAILALKEKMR
ncbi:hypothetical protein [Rhizobium leguminosarum]|uniref:hypothetical protein n=1 Tax=Rhizobium leguminosarum TaxID=384 RepID=UPI001C98A16C|nr:hypothetical protein [Rhizobium leguminosarum]